MGGMVEAVHRSASHTLKKAEQPSIRLLAGLGVDDDAHLGMTSIIEDLHRLDPALAQLCPDRQAALAVAMQALPSPAHIIVRARYAEDTLAEAMPRGHRRVRSWA